jgi:hypothetical protein
MTFNNYLFKRKKKGLIILHRLVLNFKAQVILLPQLPVAGKTGAHHCTWVTIISHNPLKTRPPETLAWETEHVSK